MFMKGGRSWRGKGVSMRGRFGEKKKGGGGSWKVLD